MCKTHCADEELLYNTNRRPYLLIIKLKYDGNQRQFALPFRSNIPSYVPKEQYFSLPPRPKTQPGNLHGLHYIKMFPIDNKFLEKFRIDNDPYYQMVLNIIDRNEKEIVDKCQAYLSEYEKGNRPKFAPNINKIIEVLAI